MRFERFEKTTYLVLTPSPPFTTQSERTFLCIFPHSALRQGPWKFPAWFCFLLSSTQLWCGIRPRCLVWVLWWKRGFSLPHSLHDLDCDCVLPFTLSHSFPLSMSFSSISNSKSERERKRSQNFHSLLTPRPHSQIRSLHIYTQTIFFLYSPL